MFLFRFSLLRATPEVIEKNETIAKIMPVSDSDIRVRRVVRITFFALERFFILLLCVLFDKIFKNISLWLKN